MEDQIQDGVFIEMEKPLYKTNLLKILVCGDPCVGKNSILKTYVTNEFPREYAATLFEMRSGKTIVDGQEHHIELWDTAGSEEYNRLRVTCYSNTHCIIVCFSVDDKNSYENIKLKWYPEFKDNCPTAKIILVGTKNDLRMSTDNCITLKEAMKMKKIIGAKKYVECSALNNDGLHAVFAEAVRTATDKTKSNSICNIL